MSKSLGSIIRTARNSAGFTQQALAELIGVSRAAVGQWESGASEPSTENFIAVCKSLGVDIESAIRGEFQSSTIHGRIIENRPNVSSDVAVINLLGSLSTSLVGNKGTNSSTLMSLFAGLANEEPPFCKISTDLFATVQRPVALKSNTDVYAVMMPNDFLMPKYQINEYIYVSTSIRAIPGDYIVVHTGVIKEIERPNGGDPLSVETCLIGQMESFGLFGIDVRQYKPESVTTVPFGPGWAFHRVFPHNELIPLMA